MAKTISVAKIGLTQAWWWLRQITGDAAYENYLAHSRATTRPELAAPKMSRAEFYADSLRRRYSTINRCC
jgi:uncharacterized short protein YbdD (DUF466 family)